MAKVIAVPPIPGVEDLLTLMAFLADSKSCSERLKELESVRSEINSLIERVGKADEIEALRTKADQAHEDAKNALAEASRKAAELISSAEETLGDARAKIDVERKNLSDERASHLQAMEQDKEILSIKASDLAAREENLSKKTAEVASQADAASKLAREADDKMTRLRNAGVL